MGGLDSPEGINKGKKDTNRKYNLRLFALFIMS